MIRRLVLSLLFATSLSCCFAQPQPPQVVKMGNGITVILVEDHATPLTAVDVWVKTGAFYETAENNGVSHFIEHMAFGSTAKYGPGEMDTEMESLGATLDARTSKDWSRYGVTVMSRYLPQALNALAEAVARPRFAQAEVEKERLIILDEIAKKETQPFKVCKDYLAQALYGDHPYARPIEGTREVVARLTRDAIVEFHRRRCAPDQIAVVIVGDVDSQRAVSEIGKAFQGIAGKAQPGPQLPAPSPPAARITKSYYGPYKLGYVAIGFLGPAGVDYKDVCAIDVLLTSLGSGYRSWMSADLRERQKLIEEGFADFLTERCAGLISIVASTPEENCDRTRDAILAKIASVRKDGISPDSLALAQRSLLGQYAFQNETLSGRAQSYGFYYTVSDPQFASSYVECIRSVTNEEIVRVAQKYLDPARAAVVTVGPSRRDAE